MAKQSHDQGVKKRRVGQRPMLKKRLEFERAKRRHPGPLPWWLRSFKAYLEAKGGGAYAGGQA